MDFCGTWEELHFHIGIIDKFDAGIRFSIWPSSVGINTKYQFLRANSNKWNLDGAFLVEGMVNHYYDPLDGNWGFFSSYYTDFSSYIVKPAIILSCEAKDAFPFSLLIGYYQCSFGQYDNTIKSFVMNIGLPARVRKNRSVRIMPEFSILLPFSGEKPRSEKSVFFKPAFCFGIVFSGANPD